MRGVEDYLAQIKRLEEEGRRATGTLLSQSLKVALPSASEMVKKLGEEGYLVKGDDGTISLTSEGRPLAYRVLLRHRLVERLLTDVLHMPWYQVHQEAHRLEHAVSARVEEALAQTLGFPDYCPHGHPMCPIDSRNLSPLESSEAEDEVGVAQISEVEENLLAYFDSMGLSPGAIIKIKEVDPKGGPFLLETGAGTVTLGREVTTHVHVCPPAEADLINRKSAAAGKV